MHEQVLTEFFICDKENDEAIGVAGIKELSPGRWTITAIALGPAYQGRGYGKQVVMALLDLAFGQYGADQVEYECFAENTASASLAVSCGFRVCFKIRQAAYSASFPALLRLQTSIYLQ